MYRTLHTVFESALIDAIPGATDSKAALDLQARIAAEQAESEEPKRLSRLGGGTGGGTRDPETICDLVAEGVDAVSKYAFIALHTNGVGPNG